MKKVLLPIAIIALGAVVTISSCKKEEVEDPVITYATISGMAYANLDETNDTLDNGSFSTQNEFATEGTKVIAVVNPMDYTNNPDATVNYEQVTYEAMVGSDGSYSFQVEAYSNDATVTIQFSDFAYDTQVYGLDADNNVIKTTERNIYTVADQMVSVVANESKVIDVTYSK